MDRINKKVLLFLMLFFEEILNFSLENKMNSYNLAVVFAPTLLKPRKISMNDLVNAGVMVTSLNEIILNFKEIFELKEIEKCNKFNFSRNKTKLIEEFYNMENKELVEESEEDEDE